MTLAERAARTVYQRPSPPKGIRARCSKRWAELLITAAAAGLFGWGLSKNGYGNEYYSAAARSMSRSWSAFTYASLDPHSWVTVDKPPMAMWTQALSARILGFHGWTLLLPSVICGALSVWVLMSTVRRAWGRTAGLAAGVVLALTPMVVAVSRSNNPDATLMLCAVLAAWATQRGIEDGEFRWLGWAGFFCGIGFLTKLLAAGLIMPGLWGAYLLCAPGRLRTRLGQCFGAAVVFFAVALAWVLAVDLRALSDRPWIGGSTDGTARDLVFGYNGFGRLTGASEGPGGNTMGGAGGPGGIGQMFGGAGGVNQFGGATGIGRLFNTGMGDQAMWFTPVAVVAALAGVVASIRHRRRDPRLGAVVMWTGWAVVVFGLYSFAEGIFHNYYISLLAPALAALVGIGIEQAHRVRLLGTVVVSATLLATAATQLVFLKRVDASTWLRVVVPTVVLAAVVGALVVAIALPAKGRVRSASFAVGGLALLLAPAIWSVAGVQNAQAGTFPDARPVSSSGTASGFGGGPGGMGGLPGGGSQITDAQWHWLESQRKNEKWILGMSSAMDAGVPLTEGRDVVALGGFSGSDGSASVARVAKAVAHGDLRYFSAGGFGGFGGGNGWRVAVSSACTAVDAAKWGGTGASSIFDCAGKATAIRKAGRAG